MLKQKIPHILKITAATAVTFLLIIPIFVEAQPTGPPPTNNSPATFDEITTINDANIGGNIDTNGSIEAGTGNNIITTALGLLDLTKSVPGADGQILKTIGTTVGWVDDTGGSGTPTLQEVTDQGATTTTNVTIGSTDAASERLVIGPDVGNISLISDDNAIVITDPVDSRYPGIYFGRDGVDFGVLGYDNDNQRVDLYTHNSVGWVYPQLVLDALTGNVGINTPNESTPINEDLVVGNDLGTIGSGHTVVIGDNAGNPELIAGENSNNYGAFLWNVLNHELEIFTYNGASGAPNTDQLILEGYTGRIGMGTDAPNSKLEIRDTILGAGDNLLRLRANGTVGQLASLLFDYSGGVYAKISSILTASGDGELAFFTTTDGETSLTEAMRINKDGYVGIGTSTPNGDLVVGDDLGDLTPYREIVIGQSDGAPRVIVGESDTLYGALMWNHYNNDMELYTRNGVLDNSDQLILDGSTGYVGIGTDAPTYRLHVDSGAASNAFRADYNSTNYFFAGTAGNGGYGRGDTYGIRGYVNDSAGSNYGLYGNAYGSATNDAIGVYGYANTGSTNDYDFYAGNTASTNYGSASSIRWKENIEPIDNVLDKVLSLRGVSFNWDEEHGGHHDIGMIAEEVGKVFPEVVGFEPDSEYANGMDYGKLTTVLVEGVKGVYQLIQDQNQVIQNQQTQIDNLQRQVDKLRALVESNS